MAGRLVERKGFQHVLQALGSIETDYEIRIAGQGDYKQELVKTANRNGLTVKFLGWLDKKDLYDEYSKSKIFAYPSVSENFPVALLEAMAGGNAVITTRSTGCMEVVGESGILVDPGDIEAIERSIRELLRNPDEMNQLQQAARKRLKTVLSWDSVVQDYISVYDRLTGRN
jgi:glycosyltransferase involved in cell wall biosynthesis